MTKLEQLCGLHLSEISSPSSFDISASSDMLSNPVANKINWFGPGDQVIGVEAILPDLAIGKTEAVEATRQAVLDGCSGVVVNVGDLEAGVTQ